MIYSVFSEILQYCNYNYCYNYNILWNNILYSIVIMYNILWYFFFTLFFHTHTPNWVNQGDRKYNLERNSFAKLQYWREGLEASQGILFKKAILAINFQNNNFKIMVLEYPGKLNIIWEKQYYLCFQRDTFVTVSAIG